MSRFLYTCAIHSRHDRHQFVPAWIANIPLRIYVPKRIQITDLTAAWGSLEQKHPNQNAFRMAIHFQSHLYNPNGKRETKQEGCNTLEEVLGRMVNMLIGKGRHEVVRVIVVRLVVDIDLVREALLLGSGFEVFGEELALLVEVVAGALWKFQN